MFDDPVGGGVAAFLLPPRGLAYPPAGFRGRHACQGRGRASAGLLARSCSSARPIRTANSAGDGARRRVRQQLYRSEATARRRCLVGWWMSAGSSRTLKCSTSPSARTELSRAATSPTMRKPTVYVCPGGKELKKYHRNFSKRARRPDEGRHAALLREKARLRRVRAQAEMLPEHARTQNWRLHS